MTSRELLAVGGVAAPALATVLVARRAAALRDPAVARRRRVADRRARARAGRASRSPTPGDPFVGDWLVVDAAGGLLVGVIGVVGLASVLVSPAYLAAAARARRPRACAGVLRCCSSRSGRCCSRCRWPGISAPPGCSSRRRPRASALLVGFSGKARALEAGWKYLILTSLGLGVALLGIVLLAAGRPGAGSASSRGRRSPTYASGSETALVAYLLLLAGLAAKIGWAPVHNWLPDAHSEAPPPVSALLSAALLPRVLLVAWRSRAGARARSSARATAQGVADRLRSRLARGRGAVPVALAGLEAAARLLEPRAHGRDRARHRLRDAARARRRRGPHRRPRDREGARLLRGDAAARPRAARGRPRRHRHRPHAARARRVDGHLARHARRAAALAALRERGADRRRRLPGRHGRGRPGATALLLALGFLGLVHALIETTAGESPPRATARRSRAARRDRRSRGVSVVLLLALAAAALWLPGPSSSTRSRRGSRERPLPRRGRARRSPRAGASRGLHATADGALVRTLLVAPDGATRLETVAADDGTRAVDRRPRAGGRLGRARGARPLRASASTATSRCGRSSTTTRRSSAGRCRVRGDDPYEVAVGPIHAGVIESGHFRFHVVGDRILHLDVAALLQAPRARAGRRGQDARRGARLRRARLRRVRGHERRRLRARLRGGARSRADRRARPRCARSCSSSSGCGATSTTSPPSAPAAASPRATTSFAALTERARRLNAALTGHRFLFGSVRVGGSELALGRDDVRAARDEVAALRDGLGSRLARAALQRVVPGPAARHRRRRGRRGASGSAPSGRPRAPRGSRTTPRDGEPAARLRRLRARRPRAGRRRRPGAARAARARAPADVRRSSTRCSTARSARPPPSRARRGAADRRRPRREPARRDELHRRAQRRPDRAAAAAHRLLRELARRRPRRRRQPAPRLPADQQELRALLRLRRPLMLTLLRDLRRLRREHRAPAARPRTAASRSATSTPARATAASTSSTLASSPYYDLQRFGLGIVASPRHADVLLVTGAVTTPHARAAARRLRRDARAAPRRRARRLRARLQRVLGTAEDLVGPVEAILARRPAHPGCPPCPTRSPRRCSSSSTRRAQLRRSPLPGRHDPRSRTGLLGAGSDARLRRT